MVRRKIPSSTHLPGGSIQLRAGTREDHDFVRDLSAEVFCQFGDYASFLPSYLEHPSVFTTIVQEDGLPLGYIMVALVLSQKPLREPNPMDSPGNDSSDETAPRWLDAEILAIAVSPTHQAHGLGHRLMEHVLTIAHAWQSAPGIRSVQLNVAHTNEKAMAFFTNWGFEILNPEDGIYPNGQRSIRMGALINAEAGLHE
jgi:ribosomal protein S18 acetylase RimI-like enzyme